MTDQEEQRIELLEERLAYYDAVIGRLIQLARVNPKGRLILQVLGLQ